MGIFSALTGTLVNTATVILGSCLGMLLGKGLPERISKALMTALGFCTMYIGITGCLKGRNALVVIVALVLGTLIGEGADLDRRVNRLGSWVEGRLSRGERRMPIAEGFVNASLLFCVGAMTVVGSLNSGLTGDHTMLYAKACLDLVSSTVFASAMGVGVTLAAGVVLVLQGGIALLAHLIAPLLSEAVIADMTCVGSLLIIGLALNLIGISKLKIMNFVPAIFLPILLTPAYEWVAAWLAGLIG